MTATAAKRTMTQTEQALAGWLARVKAELAWEAKLHDDTLRGYWINCQLVIVLQYQEGAAGWELFIPPSNGNLLADTLDGAAKALGVEGCKGLPGCD